MNWSWLQFLLDILKSINFKRKSNILVVEDNPEDADILRRYLEKLHRKCEIVNSAEEAKGALINKKYSLIFIDVRLPLMGGIELLKFIHDINPDTKNVVIFGDIEDVRKLPSGIFVSIIIKPVNLLSITKTIKVLG